jgi:hypothetical protein
MIDEKYIRRKNPFPKSTRIERRRAKKELERLTEEVKPLEDEFIQLLFQDNFISYNSLYNDYHSRITSLIEWLNNIVFKSIEVDTYYFSDKYKPIEII